MVNEHVDSGGWHPLSRPPPRSGVYAVRTKSSATPYFSAFIAQALRWSQPQAQLRAFELTQLHRTRRKRRDGPAIDEVVERQ